MSTEKDYKVHDQKTAYHTPWTTKERIGMLLFEFCWFFFCSWTPKPLNLWRLMWLKMFGVKISGRPFVHQRARIQIPWHLTLEHRSTIGDRTNIYTLGPITLKERAVIAQEVYLSTGSHDFADPDIPLMTSPIIIEEDVFIGARAFVMPGVTIGARAVVGAASVVTKDLPAGMICVGNPCKPVKPRPEPRIKA